MSNLMNLKNGDILHCQGSKPLSNLIRKFTKSKLSHTALVVQLDGMLLIADSQRDGTHLRSLHEWQKKYKYKFFVSRPQCPMSVEESAAMQNRIMSTIGIVPYDFFSLFIKQPWYLISGRWRVKPAHKENGRFYCSEFVAFVLGFELSYMMHPQMLLEYLRDLDCYDELHPMGYIL